MLGVLLLRGRDLLLVELADRQGDALTALSAGRQAARRRESLLGDSTSGRPRCSTLAATGDDREGN